MVDAKDFIDGDDISFSLINDVISNKEDSPFSICRLAIKHSEIEKAIQIGKYIKDKGYDIIVNLMGISLLSNKEIKDFSELGLIGPSALYFADS